MQQSFESNESAQPVNPIDAFVLDRIHFRVEELIRDYGYSENDREDLHQELILGLLEAMPEFDPEKGTWEGFVRGILDRRCIDLIRYELAQMRDDEDSLALAEHPSMVDGHHKPERIRRGTNGIAEQERSDLAMDIEAVGQQMTPRQREILKLRIDHDVAQIAELLGVSKTTVRTDIRNMRPILRAAGLEPN